MYINHELEKEIKLTKNFRFIQIKFIFESDSLMETF